MYYHLRCLPAIKFISVIACQPIFNNDSFGEDGALAFIIDESCADEYTENTADNIEKTIQAADIFQHL